jgi:hypothetical protein
MLYHRPTGVNSLRNCCPDISGAQYVTETAQLPLVIAAIIIGHVNWGLARNRIDL